MATVQQTIIINCDSNAETTAALNQINNWMLANPGKMNAPTVSGRKITAILIPYQITPSQES